MTESLRSCTRPQAHSMQSHPQPFLAAPGSSAMPSPTATCSRASREALVPVRTSVTRAPQLKRGAKQALAVWGAAQRSGCLGTDG